MDPASGLCRGCLRTLDEIAAWSRLDDAARTTILAAVAVRRGERRQRPLNGNPTCLIKTKIYQCVGVCMADPDSGSAWAVAGRRSAARMSASS
jgi:predicted Fe-S protein YdhL (DUF1289 family)